MLRVEFKELKTIKSLSKIIKNIVSICYWYFTESGLKINTYSNCSTMIVSVNLYVNSFTLYTCSQTIALGFNNEVLEKFLSCASDDDTVIFETRDEDPDNVYLIYLSNPKKNVKKASTYKMKLVNIECEMISLDENCLIYDHVIKVNSQEFLKIIRTYLNVGDTKQVTMYTIGDNVNNRDLIMEVNATNNKLKTSFKNCGSVGECSSDCGNELVNGENINNPKYNSSPINLSSSISATSPDIINDHHQDLLKMLVSTKSLCLAINNYNLTDMVSFCFFNHQDLFVIEHVINDNFGFVKFLLLSGKC